MARTASGPIHSPLPERCSLLGWLRGRRPRRPPVADPRGLLEARLPWLERLSPAQQVRFFERVRQFLADKRFVGCDGMRVSEDIAALIAGMACLLVLRPEAGVFPGVRDVLVYPGPFLVPVTEPDEFGLVPDEPELRVGESWSGDRVILSWEDVEAALEGGETNVVVHEFAHQLDDEDPATVGAPALRDYARWSTVMQAEFDRLRRHRRPPVLDPYGAQDPAEFFGVVTEAFFQRGPELARHHAELYRLLADFYDFETD